MPPSMTSTLERFVKKVVLEEASTPAKMTKIDVFDKENFMASKKVNPEFAYKMIIQDAEGKL